MIKPLLLSLALLCALAAPAVALPSCGTGAPIADCTLNGVSFDSFVKTEAGIAATFFDSTKSHDHNGTAADLVFQIAQSPSPALQLSDILLTYHASDPLGRLDGVDLINPGFGVAIHEIVCKVALTEGACLGAGNLLGDFVVPGSESGSASFDPVTDLYIKKDLQFQIGGFISELENSHELSPNPVPEPSTLFLLGTALSGLGIGWRRWRHR